MAVSSVGSVTDKNLNRSVVNSAGKRTLLWQMILWGMVVVSAVAVVNSTQKSRELFAQLEVLRNENNSLREDWGRYLLEQSAWGAYSRVEKVAVEDLSMQPADPSEIITLRH